MIGSIIGWIVMGAIIGALARFVKPGKQDISMVATIILGVLGSVIGGWITSLFSYSNANGGGSWIDWIVAVIVSVVLIGIYMGMRNKSNTNA
ncbi:MAG: GlsB/YeaQ/YmgE family stress response membrane protein [Corynebacterium sp.]|nr:GlsB/YeaQ/YmgE family stress response membrane protein [Corynebacterium sp.]